MSASYRLRRAGSVLVHQLAGDQRGADLPQRHEQGLVGRARREQRPELLLHVGGAVEQRLVLGREVAEEGPGRDLGGGRDVVHRGAVEAACLEQVEGDGGQQAPGAFLLARAQARGLGPRGRV
jgi:hypothetical protein